MTKYFGEFDGPKKYPLLNNIKDGDYDGFDVDNETAIEISKLNIIVAIYDKDSYEGQAFVLFEKDGKLYEVNEYHCSCNGLENWEPEETTKKALILRFETNELFKKYEEATKIIMALKDFE